MRLSQPVTQGGQTFLHKIRMLSQVLKMAFFFSAFSSIVTFGFLCWRTFIMKDIDAYVVFCQGHIIQFMYGPDKEWKGYNVSYLIDHNRAMVYWIHERLLHFLMISAVVGLFCGLIMFLIWRRQGIKAHEKKTVSGQSFEDKESVIKAIIKKKEASHICLMDIPMIKDSETQHMLITGTTGSGKTNTFKHLIRQLTCEKAVILDTTGEFVSKYYNHKRGDIIMNPFDNRSPQWDLWRECKKPYHFDDIAESLIPQTGTDLFWTQSSRTVLSEMLRSLDSKGNRKFEKVMDMANTQKLADLHKALENTKAGALIDPASEKTATSIRMNLASHIACLEHLKHQDERKEEEDQSEGFSIREWIQDHQKREWLFLIMTPDQRATLRPLLSCWLSIAIKSLMASWPEEGRRIWFLIDELPSLHRLTDLELCLSEGRKYGACMVLGVQNIPQLEKLYGNKITESLIDLCSTKLFFRTASYVLAQKLSCLIGMHERYEMQEGISYGANDLRDGVSLNSQIRERPIVPASDLLNLSDLESYVQLPNGYPITKTKWEIIR